MESEKPTKRPRIRIVRSDAGQSAENVSKPSYSGNRREESSSYSGYRSSTFNSERSLRSSQEQQERRYRNNNNREFDNYEGQPNFDRPRPQSNNPRFKKPMVNRPRQADPERPNEGFSRPVKSSNQQGGYQQGGYQQGGYQQRPRQNFKPMMRKGPMRPRLPQPVEYQDTFIDAEKPLRLNKYLSNAGICSRREADEFIKAGEVKVNGEVITELGAKVFRDDFIMFQGKAISMEKKVYVLLNKPKNCVTTSDDPEERKTVLDLVKGACKERIYPVGRLDRNTTGVLLLTNDGDLASKLTHPKYDKKKIYHVWLDKDVPMEDLEKIANGIDLEDGPIHADAISYADETDLKQIGIEIHSGRNRIVRRIFEHLGYKVYKLDRVFFAGLTKKNLGRGKWRYLSQEEVNMLRMGAFE